MIEKLKHIPELYEYNHRHDKLLHTGNEYEDNLLRNILSNVLFNNNILNSFLNLLQKNIILMIESNLIIRNMFNYTVNKYYNKHNN